MYQIIVHEYGNTTPKGGTVKTTAQLEEYLHTIECKSLVYIEVRYIRSFRLSSSVDTNQIPKQPQKVLPN